MNRPLCCRKAAQCDVKQKAGFIPAFFHGQKLLAFLHNTDTKKPTAFTQSVDNLLLN